MDGQAANPLEGVLTLDLRQTFAAIWRRRLLVGSTIFICLILALGYILTQPKEYTAETVLQLQVRQSQVVDVQAVLSNLTMDQNVVQTELDVLQSSSILGNVVDELNLVESELFNPMLAPLGLLDHILGRGEMSPEAQRRAAILELDNRTWVYNPPRSFTIKIYARGRTPEQSAQLANALAQAYLKDQLMTRVDATKRANTWLQAQLDDLRKAVTQTEQAVQNYRQANNLFEQEGLTLNDQQMSELNSQLIIARADRAEAEAKLQQARKLVRDGGAASAAEVLNSQLIQRLREQEAEVRRKEADLATRYGAKHPELIKVRAELADIKAKIENEIGSIIASFNNGVAIAKSREAELERNLRQIQQQAGDMSEAEVQLAELEREAQATRELYQSFLSRSKETSRQEDLEQTDARLVAEALVPLKPSHPNVKMTLALGFVGGLLIGLGLIALIELLDRGIRKAEQLEALTGTVVAGQIPLLAEQYGPAIPYLMKKPTSAYAEAVRSARTALHFSNPDNPPQVVLITSSVSDEGKSSFAASLAAQASQGGSKVLLIDCDMRRPSSALLLNMQVEAGLGEVLGGQCELKAALQTHEASGLVVLPSTPNTPHSNELLGTKKMSDLLDTLRKDYDLIVLDSPPINAVADPLTLTTLSDAVLFVVRWASTPKDTVLHTLKALQRANANVAGTILTQVNQALQELYGYGYYGGNKYYND